jgi:hypothetical protein
MPMKDAENYNKQKSLVEGYCILPLVIAVLLYHSIHKLETLMVKQVHAKPI